MEQRLGQRYAWACQVFGLEAGASPQAVRAAIVAHLEQAEFMPPPAWRQAIGLLCDPQAQQTRPDGEFDAFREAAENQLAEVVDLFAAEFFSLAAGPRSVKWTKLLKLVNEFPRLRARVNSLQPGLAVEPDPRGGQDQQEAILAERIRRLFVLKPADQAAQRRQWLAAMEGDWRPAVRKMRTTRPRLARLDSEFLSALMAPNRGATAESVSAIAAKTNLAAAIVPRPNAAAAAANRTRPRTTAGSGSSYSSSGLGWGRFIVVIGLVSLSRIFTQNQGNYNNNNNYNYSPPSYQQPRTPSRSQNSDESEQMKRIADDIIRHQLLAPHDSSGKERFNEGLRDMPFADPGNPVLIVPEPKGTAIPAPGGFPSPANHQGNRR
jgi:hypothetical protein